MQAGSAKASGKKMLTMKANRCNGVLHTRPHFDSTARHRLRANSHPEDSAPVTGNPAVQEQLMTMIRLQMGKQAAKETYRDSVTKFAQTEAEKMKKSNEKAKEEIEKQERLLRERSNSQFDQALAEINKKADDFEAQLRASRAKMEQGQKEFETWEDRMMTERNKGYFFQRLYETDRQKAKRKGKLISNTRSTKSDKWSNLLAQSEVANQFQQAAPTQKSNVRASIFVFLALNLSCLAIADILSDTPAYMLDALHAALAVALLTSVWFERQILTPSNKEDRGD